MSPRPHCPRAFSTPTPCLTWLPPLFQASAAASAAQGSPGHDLCTSSGGLLQIFCGLLRTGRAEHRVVALSRPGQSCLTVPMRARSSMAGESCSWDSQGTDLHLPGLHGAAQQAHGTQPTRKAGILPGPWPDGWKQTRTGLDGRGHQQSRAALEFLGVGPFGVWQNITSSPIPGPSSAGPSGQAVASLGRHICPGSHLLNAPSVGVPGSAPQGSARPSPCFPLPQKKVPGP